MGSPNNYGSAAFSYLACGWKAAIPVDIDGKPGKVLRGFTGETRNDPTPNQVRELAAAYANHNLGLALPPNVVGFDVDHYGDKTGAETLAKLEAELGPLPKGPMSSARGYGKSGIWFFQVPTGFSTAHLSNVGKDIDLIRFGWRWARVWPSTNPKTGEQYQWYGATGTRLSEPPRPSDFPMLPDTWLQWLETRRAAKADEPTEVGEVEPFDLAAHEWLVQSLEADAEKVKDGERHNLGFRLACRCAEKGLTRGEAYYALTLHAPTTAKVVEEHGHAEGIGAKQYIESTINRAYAKHSHEGQTCESAECPNKPITTQLKYETQPTDEDVEALEALLLDSDQLVSLADPEPLIDGLLYRDTINSLIAKPGDGKSFLALSMAGAVGTGRQWYGRPVDQGLVIYLVAEGVRGIKKRVRAWEKVTGVPMTNVKFIPFAIQANAKEWETLIRLCAKLQPTLIIIDTQARVTVGMEENSSKDMGEFVEKLERLRQSCGACVLDIHHKGRSGENGRGSSALDGAVSTILAAKKERDEKTGVSKVTLSNSKQKDDEEAADIIFEFHSVDLGTDDNGKPLTSAVLKLSHKGPANDSYTDNEESILSVMRSSFTQGGTKSEIKEASGVPKSSFYRLFDGLLARQAIEQRGNKYFVVTMTIRLAKGI